VTKEDDMTNMIDLIAVILTALAPILFVAALLVLAEWRDRREAAQVARQIHVTDALADEVGAIVAPVVRKRWGGWRVEIPAPLGRPGAVGRIVSVVSQTLRGTGRYEIVLTPQDPVVAATAAPRPAPTPRNPRLSRLSAA
jgi:hypothetical protein